MFSKSKFLSLWRKIVATGFKTTKICRITLGSLKYIESAEKRFDELPSFGTPSYLERQLLYCNPYQTIFPTGKQCTLEKSFDANQFMKILYVKFQSNFTITVTDTFKVFYFFKFCFLHNYFEPACSGKKHF